jgi:hypothetical protein
MRVGRTSICVLLAAVLVSGSALLDTASAQQQHITATVTGAKIQKVGFRASARRQGPDRSDSRCHSRRQQEILAQQYNRSGPRDPNLKTFTIFAWTSTGRKITNPYDLVFSVRPTNDQTSHKDAKAMWNTIAENTLKGEDLGKFLKHLDDDD